MSRWRYGCDAEIEVDVPRGFTYRTYRVRCGSTAYDGGVNQCERCARDPKLTPPPTPEYGDIEHDYDREP